VRPQAGQEFPAVAFVRRGPGSTADAVGLEWFLRQRLAAFKVPRRWVFVESFPLTASGKVQKFVLRDRFLEGEAGHGAGAGTHIRVDEDTG